MTAFASKISRLTLESARLALPLLTAIFSFATAHAETVPSNGLELDAFAGYDINSSVNLSAGTLVVNDAPSFGLAVDIPVRPAAFAEVLWVYSSTNAQFNSDTASAPSSLPFKLDMSYFQIGGTQGFPSGPFEPFISLTAGAVLYLPGDITLQNGSAVALHPTWEFAFTGGGGLKVFLTQALALRFQARIQAPVYFTSSTLYAGSGGAALVVTGGVPFIQGDFTAGILFAP